MAQYLHESRHKHAISRVRGKKGRFVNQNDDTPAHRRPSDSSDSGESSFTAFVRREGPELHPRAREPKLVLAAPAMLANPVYRQPAPTPQPVAIYR